MGLTTKSIAQIPSTNLMVHLDAGSGVNVTDDRVDSWDDLSGLGNHGQVEQSSTRPYLVSNVINGHSAVYFNGTNHYIYLPTTINLGLQNNDYELFVVVKTEESNSTTQYILAGGINELELSLNEPTNDWGLLFKQNSGTNVHSGSLGSLSNTQPFIVNVSGTATEAALNVDNYSYSISESNYQTSFAGNILLGIRSGGSSPFKGYIAEVVMYNAKLSTQARDSVNTYLYTKYFTPTVQSSNIIFSEQTHNTVKLSLTKGNGLKRIILAKENSPVDAVPVDLTNYNTQYSTSFPSAYTLGTDNKILYVGTDTVVTIYGLSIGKTYHFAAFEFNLSYENIYDEYNHFYLTTNPAVNSIEFVSPFAAGTGIEEDPYQIATPNQLNDIRYAGASYFILNNDIDLNVSPYNTGEGWNPIDYFYGNLNGNGFAIRNLQITSSTSDQGLISNLYGNVSDVELSNFQLTIGDGVDGVGCLASNLSGGTVNRIVVNGSITAGNNYAYSIGGLVGEIAHGTVKNSVVDVDINFIGTGFVHFGGAFGGAFGEVSGTVLIDSVISHGNVIVSNGGVNDDPIGGFIGIVYGSNVTITNSASYGNVVGDISLGGFVGLTYDGLTISNSFSTGNVTSRTIGEDVGGFMGYLYDSSISNSFTTGNVIIETAGDRVGGFVGNSDGGTISNSFALGSVSNATHVGGFVGTNTGTVTNSFWNTLMSGQATSAAGTSKTLTELSQAATFSNWDLENIWLITDGASMPWLRTNPSTYRIGIPTLTGTEGWRLLASPVIDSSYASYFKPLWTQGITGADYEQGAANIYSWSTGNGTNENTNWTALSTLNTSFAPGIGVLAYVYSDDDGPGNGNNAAFPKKIIVDGFEANENQNVTSSLNTNLNGWTLLGNPFIQTVDWDAISKANISGSVYVWDHNNSEWKTWNGSIGSLTDGKIAPFNAFFVETLTENPSLTIPTSAIVPLENAFLGKETNKETSISLALILSDNTELSNKAWIQFSESGNLGIDANDALKLSPLATNYVQIGTVLKDGKVLDINHLPTSNSYIELPIELRSSHTGAHSITLDRSQIPASWEIRLYDAETGKEVSLDKTYGFTLANDAKKSSISANQKPSIEALQQSSTRFTLRISGITTTTEEPVKNYTLALNQNYPNPFNPTTNLSFSLAKPGFVSIKVYDIMGRLISEPVSSVFKAGEYNQNFNASRLSSGIYFYTMSIDGNIYKTMKMTLIK